MTVERGGDLGEVDGADLQEGDDEAGDELEPAHIEVQVGLWGVLDGFMLHSATWQDWVALIVSRRVRNGDPRVLSGSQVVRIE